MKPTLLILAAGMGSRYGGLKQVDSFGPSGEAIIEYSIYDAIRTGFGKVVFVISKKIEEDFKSLIFSKLEGKVPIEYVLQELHNLPEGFEIPADRVKPWGTGHAVLVAASKIKEPFAVINADDFYGASSFKLLADYLSAMPLSSTDYCMVGYQLKNTLSENGSVSRGICEENAEHFLQTITERTKIVKTDTGAEFEDEDGKVYPLTGSETTSMNMMGFPPSLFEHASNMFKEFLTEKGGELKAEFYLPSIVNQQIQAGSARMKVLPTSEIWFGVTYQQDKEVAVSKIRELVEQGVYPANLWK